MLTIEDLRNSERKSSFNHVGSASAGPNGGGKTKLWRARVYKTGKAPHRKDGCAWTGPSRPTPEEAAQDYCDYINGNNLEVTGDVLNFPGHEGKRDSLPRTEEVEAALGVLRDHRAAKEGKPGYVYLIGVELDPYAVKVGFSTNVQARLKEHQTGNPRKLFLIGSFQGTLEDEKRLHKEFIDDNLWGEWFRPSAELFSEFGLEVEEDTRKVILA